MSRIFIGLGAAAVVAVGGYFGAQAYIQHRIAGEIEANFAQIRASGGTASRGDLSFDLWHRRVAISDIAVTFTAPQAANIKVGHFTASNVGLNDGSMFTADDIVLTDINAGGALMPAGGIDVTVKAPRFEIIDFVGPTRVPARGAIATPVDLYRTALAQFAAISATSMTAPTVTVTAKGTALPGGAEYVYSDLASRDIRNGKVAASSAGRVNVAMSVNQAGKMVRMTGEIVDITAQDFDANAAATVLDPAHASDDKFYRVQGPVSAGAYTLTSDGGPSFRIDGIRMGDMKVQPSKFRMQQLLAALPAAGTTPDPTKARAMIETVATTYEGIQIDKAEMLGLSAQLPDGPLKIAAMRFDIDRGKVGEFAVEGIDANSKEGPFKVGRFALKGFDFAGLMRQTAQISAVPGATPSADAIVGMLKSLESLEIKDMAVPHKDSGKLITLHDASLSWGQFVGAVPSKIHMTLNMTGPLEEKDGEPFTLLRDVGIDEATANLDLGLVWDERTKQLKLTPGQFEIGKLFAVTADMSIDNVARDTFSTNPQQALVAASAATAGTLKLTLHDLGAVDLALAQRARSTGTTVDAVRNELVDQLKTKSAEMVANQPGADQIGAAAAAFIAKPNSTLTVTIAPKQTMPLLQMIDEIKTLGPEAMSLFRIDAQTGL